MATDPQSRPIHMTRQKSLRKWARSPIVKIRRYTDDTVPSPETSSNSFPLLIRKTVLESKPSQPRRWTATLPGRQQVSADMSSQTPLNVLEWLQISCPTDILPKVLAFAGPQMMSRLNGTNHFFHETMQNDETWRVICEELYKWTPGDKMPANWFDLYKWSPCVPIDYSTVPKALEIASSKSSKFKKRTQKQVRPIRILLRPGVYHVKESMTIQSQKHFNISIETMCLPDNLFPSKTRRYQEIISTTENAGRMGLRQLLSCRRMNISDMIEPTEIILDDGEGSLQESATASSRSTLVFRTRRHNEPLFRVQQGHLILKELDIIHFCEGMDIWNGNAAVQIQPSVDDITPRYARPSAILEHVSVTSQSGRGIVNIDGGTVVLRQCAILDCAATGLYIGGPGSHALVEHCDVFRNGVGNFIGGVTRGHSGLYLEQGTAHIANCKISSNTLTGISAVSPANAILTLESSDLVANGSNQLELPSLGSLARQKTVLRNNQIASNGCGHFRSGLIAQI